jgi:hypothetical protein
VHINKSWSNLTGFQQHELGGKSIRESVFGSQTETEKFDNAITEAAQRGIGYCTTVFYTSRSQPFMCTLIVRPILNKDAYTGEIFITHFLVLFSDILYGTSAPIRDKLSESLRNNSYGENQTGIKYSTTSDEDTSDDDFHAIIERLSRS